VAPEWFVRIRETFLNGDLKTAQKLQFEVNRFIKFWLGHGKMAGLKAASAVRGIPVGTVRAPMPPITAKDLGEIEQFTKKFFA
jgi:dihydrodipicolinate synthase/N-acetylneuraminate lyase